MDVVVVGAGPVGCMMALLLTKKGHRVRVYETYGEVRSCKSRSINITLSSRGLRILQRVLPDIEDLLELGVPVYGRVVHHRDGSTSEPTYYDYKRQEALVSFKRNQLADVLLAEVKKAEIPILFYHELISCESDSAKLTFRVRKLPAHKSDSLLLKVTPDLVEVTPDLAEVTHDLAEVTPDLVEVTSDLVIGADGAHSTVRRHLLQHSCLRHFQQTRHDHAYLEFHIPQNRQLMTDMLHVWPRQDFMLLALPNTDGTFCGNLFMPRQHMQQALRSDTSLLDFWHSNFPDILAIVGSDNLLLDLQPSQDLSPHALISSKCAPYHGLGRFVLVGDAAHTVVPFYGQGMNAGFQDCEFLENCLDTFGHDKNRLPDILDRYSETNCQNGHAIADLAQQHYLQLRSGISSTRYHLRRQLDRFLNRCVPDHWPLEYNNVAFSQVPYADCLREKERQDRIVCCFCRLLMLALALMAVLVSIDVLSPIGHVIWELTSPLDSCVTAALAVFMWRVVLLLYSFNSGVTMAVVRSSSHQTQKNQ